MNKIKFDSSAKFFISVLGLIAIFIVLKELQHIFIPLVLAYFLFFVFQPLNNFLIKKKFPKSLTTYLDILLVVLFVWGLSRIIIASFERFSESIPLYEAKLNGIIKNAAISIGINDPVITNFNLMSYLNDTLDMGGIAGGFFSSTLSFFSTVFFILFFFIFISGGHDKIVEAIRNRYNHQVEDKKNESEDEKNKRDKKSKYIDKTFEKIVAEIQNYLVAKFFISLATALAVGIVLWIFDIDFLVVWIVLTFLLNFIPNIGSFLAVIMPTLVCLVQYESFGYAALFAAIITGVQNFFGNVLEPKIMGDKLGLNPLVILFSLLVWGYIWGLVGMFLSIPLTAIIKILVSESDSPNLKFIRDMLG